MTEQKNWGKKSKLDPLALRYIFEWDPIEKARNRGGSFVIFFPILIMEKKMFEILFSIIKLKDIFPFFLRRGGTI